MITPKFATSAHSTERFGRGSVLCLPSTARTPRHADVAVAAGEVTEIGKIAAGSKRSVMPSRGVEYTLVNGEGSGSAAQ